MCEGISMVKRSRILKLNIYFELYIMEKDEIFDNFYALFSNIFNKFYNLEISICEEKQNEKIIASLLNHFYAKVTIIESIYKPKEFIFTELVGDLQVFKLPHLLLRKK